MAEQYSRGRTNWVDARWRLIDEVLAYRRNGALTQTLLDACEAEFSVASWPYSEGIRRLAELANDGHLAATTKLEALLQSKDWRVRYEVLLRTFLKVGDQKRRLELLARALADRSRGVRCRLATDAVFSHLMEAIPLIENAAAAEASENAAQELFRSSYYLRRNDRAGTPGLYGGGKIDDEDRFEAEWAQFRLTRQGQSPVP